MIGDAGRLRYLHRLCSPLSSNHGISLDGTTTLDLIESTIAEKADGM
jgi:hypothetical protein